MTSRHRPILRKPAPATHSRPHLRTTVTSLGFLLLAVFALTPFALAEEDAAPLALRGLDPVRLLQGEEVGGEEDLAVVHNGYRYLFGEEATREVFEGDPERYRIQNQTCPVVLGATPDPALFAVYDGKIWAFATEECVEEFHRDPDLYVEGVMEYENQAGEDTRRRRVALVIYEGVELLDFAGPGEVFAATGHGRTFDVFTVGPSREPVTSQGFVEITPSYSFADAPAPDVVVVPGGGVRSLTDEPKALDWLRRVSGEAEVVMSVCNGALVLARAGLLDGLEATTHHASLGALRQVAPTATVHDDRRFVDNGRVVTAAGVSAGIDAALHLVARLLGEAEARRTARYMEYPWQPDGEEEPPGRVAEAP